MQFRSRPHAVAALVGYGCFVAFWIGLVVMFVGGALDVGGVFLVGLGLFFFGGIFGGLVFLALSVPRGGNGALDAIGEHIETHVSLRRLSTARAAVAYLRNPPPA